MNSQYRLTYHLMGEYGWINDPNGFIQYKDSYHVFYQHHPYDSAWGPMYWGHAESCDLIRWRHLPLALAPGREYDRDGCFSGSAMEVDDRLILMYTGHVHIETGNDKVYKQTQCLASSQDGIAFEKAESNPVIDSRQLPEEASKKDFRDPKVFERDGCYYAVIGSEGGQGNGQVLLYRSENLKIWEFVGIPAKSDGTMGRAWECPDLFRIQDKDVLMLSPQYLKARGNDFHNLHSSIYMIGDLDIEKGTFDYTDFLPVDYGFDFYAPQTTLDSKGRRLMIAWMDMWETPMPTQINGDQWAGAMTLPREIFVVGDSLYFKPVEEIQSYRKNEFAIQNCYLDGEEAIDTYGDCYELEVCFDAKQAVAFGLKLRVGGNEETVLSYNTVEKLFRFNRGRSGIGPGGERRTEIDLIDNRLDLQVFVDKCSVEVFINGGEKVMTGRIYPGREAVGITAFSKGECEIVSLRKWDIEI